jgi:hypothetical protein
MDVGEAVRQVRAGARVRRRTWEDGVFLCYVKGVMIVPDASSSVRKFLPVAVDLKCGAHALVRSTGGVWEPGWTPSQADLFADDWEVLAEPSQ